jgi:LSU ribosomal protein L16P
MPSRVKFRKHHLKRIKGVADGAKDLHFGDYGLKTLKVDILHKDRLRLAGDYNTFFTEQR